MSLNCAIPGCLSTEHSKQLFRFPDKNPSLLNQWQDEIPVLDLMKLNLIKSFICEDHFESDQIEIGKNFIKQLIPEAVPSLSKCLNSIDLGSCRFCLEKLPNEASKINIEDKIRKDFEDLFHENFNSNENLPNFCCQKCSEQFTNFTYFKTRVVKNQKCLEQLLEEKNETFLNMLPVQIKKEFEEVNVLGDPNDYFVKAESIENSEEEEEEEEDKIQITRASRSENKFINKIPQDLSKTSASCKKKQKSDSIGEKVLRCQVCNNNFGTKNELNSHIIKTHVDSDQEDGE